MSWIRARFEANLEDSRPIKWPPIGPFWESGFNDEHAIIIAYVKDVKQVTEYWPEANNIEYDENVAIKFTDRFPKPDYWKER